MRNPWDVYNGEPARDPSDPGDPGGDDGTGRDLAQQREDCRASGGRWIPNGPYGQGTCTPADAPETGPRADGCPEGQERSPHDANGNDAGNNMECVSHAEAQRRFDLRKTQNQNGTGGSTSSGGTYSPPAPKSTKSPYDAAMSKTLFDTLTNMINGGDAPFSADTIAKLSAAALQSNKGQLANSRQELQKRLINSGLSRSGVAPASYQKLESAANVDLSNNLRTVATTAVQKNYEARVTALNQAQQFLQSERANSLSQDQLILAYARLKQEWATTQSGYDQQWKVLQNGNEQEMVKLMLCLRTGVC